MVKKDSASEKKLKQENLRKNVVMDEHKIDLSELCSRYQGMSVDTGLTTAQATAGLLANGKNELTPPYQRPMWLKFIDEMTGFFSLLLWAGGILCFVSYALKPDDENLVLGIILVSVVSMTGVFSFYQNQKSDNLMAEFAKLKPPKVNVKRDGKKDQFIDSNDITLGDICHLKTGDLVPADLRVLETIGNCTVDNASLTGESEPQKRKTDFTHDDPLETANLAFFGTQVPEGELIGICVKVGDDTMMGRIATLALSTDADGRGHPMLTYSKGSGIGRAIGSFPLRAVVGPPARVGREEVESMRMEFAKSARRKDDVGAFGVVSEKRTYWFAATADETVLWLVALRAILAK